MKDHDKFADALVLAFKKKGAKPDDSHAEPDSDEPETEGADESDEKPEPGHLGKMAIAAIKHGDGEAFEEAIRKICSDDYK